MSAWARLVHTARIPDFLACSHHTSNSAVSIMLDPTLHGCSWQSARMHQAKLRPTLCFHTHPQVQDCYAMAQVVHVVLLCSCLHGTAGLCQKWSVCCHGNLGWWVRVCCPCMCSLPCWSVVLCPQPSWTRKHIAQCSVGVVGCGVHGGRLSKEG